MLAHWWKSGCLGEVSLLLRRPHNRAKSQRGLPMASKRENSRDFSFELPVEEARERWSCSEVTVCRLCMIYYYTIFNLNSFAQQ